MRDVRFFPNISASLVAKHFPCRRIYVPDSALIVDGNDAVRRRFCQNVEAAIILINGPFSVFRVSNDSL